MCRTKEIVPIGQGCKPYTKKDAIEGNFVQGMCQRHFWLYLNVCLMCGEKFHSKRPHTKTCSNKCRMAKSRARRFDKVYQTMMTLVEAQ